MGNKNSKANHLETAQKTGCCTLSKMGLEELPADLFKINIIRSLDISQNKLQNLPQGLGRLTNLKMLNLSFNRISALDQTLIAKWTKLENLIAHSNSISQMPKFPMLRHLKSLDFSNNVLTSISTSVYSLPQLDMLNLQNNKITSIPEENIQKLYCVEINLNQNQINRLPTAIKKCERLKVLRIEENCLESISSEILADSKIAVLHIGGNILTEKDLRETDGYEKYSQRFTESKRKAD